MYLLIAFHKEAQTKVIDNDDLDWVNEQMYEFFKNPDCFKAELYHRAYDYEQWKLQTITFNYIP